ncbi:MAG: MFS transporter [Methylocystis sp.]|nr:MFS transporter [Methylocystis sp.]
MSPFSPSQRLAYAESDGDRATMLPDPETSLAYPGWRVVAGAFLQSLAAFSAAWAFAAFAVPIGETFGASRAALGAVFGMQIGLMMVLAPLGGLLADRCGTRATCLAGTALMAAGLLATAQAGSLGAVMLAYGVLPGAGLAAGIAASGVALGTMIGTPVAMALVEALGWRATIGWFGLALLLVGGAGALLLRDRPRGAAAPGGPGLREVALSPAFVRMVAGNALGGFATMIPLGYLVPSATTRGVDAALLPLLMTLIGVGSLSGRVVLGGLADRFGRVRCFALLYLFQGAAFLLWLAAPGFAAFAVFALLHGMAYGAIVALRPSVVADLFQCRSMTTLTGLVLCPLGVAAGLGAIAMGWSFDATGSYAPAIAASALAAAAAGLLLLPLAGRRPG